MTAQSTDELEARVRQGYILDAVKDLQRKLVEGELLDYEGEDHVSTLHAVMMDYGVYLANEDEIEAVAALDRWMELDHFSEERAEIYHQKIVQELKM